jgi:cholesterol oxidase
MALSRRDFLRSGGIGLGVLGTGLKSYAAHTEHVEALVIGSGFGGSIAALRLAEAGVKVVVLERGRRWPITDAQDTFCTFEKPDGRSSWLSNVTTDLAANPIDVYTGVLELINGNGVVVRNGAGVGGGSLVYNAIILQPSRELFERVFPLAINYDEMVSKYYPRVRSIIKSSTMPNFILNTPYYESTRVNLEQAQAAGFNTRLTEVGVNWKFVHEEIIGRRRPSAIDGQSWFGLNSGAKNSVDRNYLAMAEATGRVEVLPLHVVVDISQDGWGGVYTVSVNQIDTNGKVIKRRVFTTKSLFLAAGSTGTASILTKAKAKGTLPRLSQYAGQGWGSNGDFIEFRSGVLPRDGSGTNNAGQGGPCGHILMEDTRNPYSPTNLVELVTPKNSAFPGASLYVGLGVAPPVGYFTYNAATDSTTLNWPGTDPRLAPAEAGADSMVSTLNGSNPGSASAFFSTALTAHPVGGANAGLVCDMYGRVFGYSGLYVVDGAFVPGGSVGGVNPSFTIAALAERSMEHIVERDV